MEQKKNLESPGGSSALSRTEGTGLFYRNGEEIPPTHPDHGPMHLLPRQENGRFAAYYYCSKAELDDAGIPTPPPRRHRRDGFTPERQEMFIEEIRGGASGREAARKVGISPTTAYNLYNSPDAHAFRQGWDEAARTQDLVLEDTAFDRAVNGQEEIVYYQGQQVGLRWKYDNKLLMFMLRARNPLKYAPLSEIEGWLRHRGIEPPPDVDGALDRLRAAEAEWGRRLPGEGEPPHLAAPHPPRPIGESEDEGAAGREPASVVSTSSTLPTQEPSVVSTSSTSPAGEDPSVVSTSSTSPDPADPPQPSSADPPPAQAPVVVPMSIFGKIRDAIFGRAQAAPASVQNPAMPQMKPAAPAQPAAVDVDAVLANLASNKGEKLNYQSSIVDLMKLLDLDSSLANRQELATELGYAGAKDGSAEMNIWLHKRVIAELEKNGGKVSAALRD